MQTLPITQPVDPIVQVISVLAPMLFIGLPFVFIFGTIIVVANRSRRRFERLPDGFVELPRMEDRKRRVDIVIEASEVSFQHDDFPSLTTMAEKALANARPATTMALALSNAADANHQLRGDTHGIPLIVREVGSPAPYSPYSDPQYYQKEEHWRHKPAGT